MARRTFLCRLIFCAVFSVSIINIFTSASSPSFFLRYSKPAAQPREEIICPHSELADDVLVILRTGATESREKVPVHFRTTLRCVPHFVVFSDLDEEIEGHQVVNVLDGVSDVVKDGHEDFKLYNELQSRGRKGLGDQKVITAESGSSKGDYLNTDNEGWRLDKWKFGPMVDKAYQAAPSARWFVFIEADTYFVWNNLLDYLSHFDASKPYYIGKHLYINDIEFGYGGAGIIMSSPAMRKASEHRSVRIRDYEDFTATHWVGDCALGKIMEDVKIPLFRAFPHLQGDSPSTLNPNTTKADRNLWCYPAVTYHHVSPSEIESLWRFEQSWFKRHDVLLRHRDIFNEHVRPQIKPHVREWDNLSADKEYNNRDHSSLYSPLERDAWHSYEKCHALCESKRGCVQFAWEERRCSLNYSFKLGYAKPKSKVRSGWMMDRVDDLFLELENGCGVRDWYAPSEQQSELRRRR